MRELARWEPFGQFVREQMDRIMDEALRGFGRGDGGRGWQPAVDVSETNEEVVVTADLPGIDREQLDIDITDSGLTLKGQIRHEEHTEREGLYRAERRVGAFFRAIPFPVEVDSERATARYQDGVLEVRAPKRQGKGRKLPIQFQH